FVTISIAATAHEAQLRVQDTGGGIAKEALPTMMGTVEQLPTLFDRFQSLGGIHDRKMGGLGLGLFIAKSMVEGHGGTISVESTVGEGTLMTVHLPKEPAGGGRRDVTGRAVAA
ncbi:MAG: ATP-binding protein, partial [Dehalococcoidia bacterium]|nr:ATP-binding protein [Dehalococcoidia bacterium]